MYFSDVHYAETWDVEATEATMIQFDLYGPCSTESIKHKHLYKPPSIRVEYSTDGGDSWSAVKNLCAPPDTSCPSYDLPSVYTPLEMIEGRTVKREKRRVMLELPRTVS